jgi:hypothetical protein
MLNPSQAHKSELESELRDERREERHAQRKELREIRDGGVIGEKTSVRIGLLLTIALLLTGGFGTSVWWAATISTKLDAIIISQGIQTVTIGEVQADVADLKAWRKVIDVAGTPSASVRLDALSAHLNTVEEMIKLHIAKEDGTKPNSTTSP